MLYGWLNAQYPRITERYNRAEILARRKQFTIDNPDCRVNMTLMRHEFLRFLATESDYDAEILVRDGFDVFFEARQQVTFYDDVLPSLERLKRSYRLGSISNGNASIEHVGLGHIFEHSVSAADHNVAKPDKRIYLKLAEHFKVLPEQVLYVGDHPEYDVVGPEQAGMPAVWINRQKIPWPDDLPEPRFQVADLRALEELLAKCRTSQ